jgi:hypothetical protein
MTRKDPRLVPVLDLIGSLVTSGLGSGIVGIEEFALCYEANGDPGTAAAARELARRIRRQRRLEGAPEPEQVEAVVSQGGCDAYVRFWFNHRIYRVDHVWRTYTDTSDVSWLEVQATWDEDCGDEAAEYRLVATIPVAAVEIVALE